MKPNTKKNQAHTLTEVLIAGVILVFLFSSVLGAFVLTKNVFSTSITNYNLQRDVNNILTTIIRGMREQAGTFGLRSAVSIPNPPGLLPSPGQNSIEFTSADDNTRRYFLNGNTIVYSSPTQIPNQKVIYTAPPNSNIIMRFEIGPKGGTPIDQQVVYIYIAVTQQIAGKTYTGSIATNVNLRNMPK